MPHFKFPSLKAANHVGYTQKKPFERIERLLKSMKARNFVKLQQREVLSVHGAKTERDDAPPLLFF